MPEPKRITIADVAKAAGVSIGTVSRVVNGRSGNIRVSAATEKQVWAAVEKLGYQPNLFASALRTQRTGVMGAIVRDINDPFLSLLACELQQVSHTEGLELLLGHAQYDPRVAGRQLSVMRAWFDALLIIGDMVGHQAAISLVKSIDSTFEGLDQIASNSMPLVSIDDAYGTRTGMEYLYSLGHRRIAFIGNTEYLGVQERYQAFRNFTAEHALPWHDDYYRPCPNQRGAAAAAAQGLLQLPEPPTAIFAMSDLQAISAISAAWEAGWSVPSDISVMGFDDVAEAPTTHPALTTLHQPVSLMAERAFKLVMAYLNGTDIENEAELPIVVRPQLVIRRSCAAPAAPEKGHPLSD